MHGGMGGYLQSVLHEPKDAVDSQRAVHSDTDRPRRTARREKADVRAGPINAALAVVCCQSRSDSLPATSVWVEETRGGRGGRGGRRGGCWLFELAGTSDDGGGGGGVGI